MIVAMQPSCAFCEIELGRIAAATVALDADVRCIVDLRQHHPGHMLVIPRRHVADLREVDEQTGAALSRMLIRITRAVSAAFPNEGLSLWQSIGPAAMQEVPHLHWHVHPRRLGDDLLRVYPEPPENQPLHVREVLAQRVRAALDPSPSRSAYRS